MQSPIPPSVPPNSDPSATAPQDGAPAAPESTSRRRFRTLLQPFATTRSIATPIIWFFLDWFVLIAAIATMLVVDSIWVRIFASLVAALWIARLFVIGHDACHGSYTPRKRLNAWIGRIAFLPSLTPYSLWEVGHNLAHHGFTNLKGRDYVWTPFTREEFMKLPWLRRQMEKLYRSGFGQGVYYMIELWWKKLFFPTREHVSAQRKSFTWDSLLVAAFGALWIGGLVAWAIISHRSVVSMLIFGFAIPFFVWNCLMGFVIYVQHTHPRVAWYERKEEWTSNAGYATTTVHIKLMRPLDGLIHYILEHGAHHVNMGIPLYRLKEAQARLSATLDERLNSEVFTWRYYWNTVRRCKLYDYARHVWTDFEGRVTSEPVVQPLAQ
jgi:acyl-lipid omega-6 desaturase (Delta-12 desaturase)